MSPSSCWGPGRPPVEANTPLPPTTRYNLLFFASGGGKFNYQGTKRWLEDNLDHTGERPQWLGLGWDQAQGTWGAPGPHPAPPTSCGRPADSSLLQDNVAFVLCLDTVGRGDSLHLHVSKPPREGTLQHAFLRELETVGAPGRCRYVPGTAHLTRGPWVWGVTGRFGQAGPPQCSIPGTERELCE